MKNTKGLNLPEVSNQKQVAMFTAIQFLSPNIAKQIRKNNELSKLHADYLSIRSTALATEGVDETAYAASVEALESKEKEITELYSAEAKRELARMGAKVAVLPVRGIYSLGNLMFDLYYEIVAPPAAPLKKAAFDRTMGEHAVILQKSKFVIPDEIFENAAEVMSRDSHWDDSQGSKKVYANLEIEMGDIQLGDFHQSIFKIDSNALMRYFEPLVLLTSEILTKGSSFEETKTELDFFWVEKGLHFLMKEIMLYSDYRIEFDINKNPKEIKLLPVVDGKTQSHNIPQEKLRNYEEFLGISGECIII